MVELKVADPPEMDKIKSFTSSSPVPLAVLNTLSEIVTEIVLSFCKVTDVIVGYIISSEHKAIELLI